MNKNVLLKGEAIYIERMYVYQDRTFKDEKFDTSLTKLDQQIKSYWSLNI